MINILLDTDIDTDCDDAGALAVLHAFLRRGSANALGVICSVPYTQCAVCTRAINEAYGRSDIPVGLVRIPDWETSSRYAAYRRHRQICTGGGAKQLYNEVISSERCANSGFTDPWPDAVALYREVLSQASDCSVTVCAIGTLTAICGLLESPPDSISPLCGAELVAAKVRLLVTMAKAGPPVGKDAFNWAMDLPAAGRVVSDWPTDLVVSSYGNDVPTGARFMSVAPDNHPVCRAYRIFLRSEDKNRPSWDQLALTYAVLGSSSPLAVEWYDGLVLNPDDGVHEWGRARCAGRRGHLSLRGDPGVAAEQIEDLMIESLSGATG